MGKTNKRAVKKKAAKKKAAPKKAAVKRPPRPRTPRIVVLALDLDFPEPAAPLLQGPGKACSWRECMHETAAQTIYFLKHYGHLRPPPLEEPFGLD